jgi:beta-1,4-galactosyltransferase 4
MRAYLPGAGILVVEQADSQPFNRGKLFNAGVREHSDYAYYIFHDVDKIPVAVDYSFPSLPTQLEVNAFQKTGYFGGVTMFNGADFRYVNGFSNEFWGWGGEDNEMYLNTSRLMQVVERPGVFRSLPHKKNGTFNQAAWIQSQRPRTKDDGLSNCMYKLVSSERNDHALHLKIEL